jgi:glycosyltransferase involved in cell wall biosynthesis
MNRRDLRILELGMHFDPAGGGADRYFAGLLQGLAANRAEFTAAAFGSASLGLGKRLSAIKSHLSGALDSHDLLASHFALYAHPLLGALRRKRKAHVVHFHGPWADESAGEGQSRLAVWAKRFVERRVYASADRLITLSGAFRDILVERYGVAESKIAVIPGGVDLERFRPACTRAEARERLGWPVDRQIVFCIRRLVRRMGLENLLDAFAQIVHTAPKHPDALLVIGGKGPLKEELQARATALGIGDRVNFAGFIPDDDLPFAYTAADFTIVPSVALEGFGLITLESLACGTPVLVTPVGGLPETVTGLEPGLVLPASTVDALADGLRGGFSGPLPSYSRCREYAEARFGWPEIAHRVLSVYSEAMRAVEVAR